MANFRYQATDAAGRSVTGEVEADNVQQAVVHLETGGLTVQSIGSAASWTPDPSEQSRAAKDQAGDAAERPKRAAGESVEQAVLRSHMARILDRGRVILPALKAYAEEMPAGRQRRQLQSACRILASGAAAGTADALSDLPEFWIPLLSAATSSTDPGHVLREFLTESRRIDDIRRQWLLTLAYPILLVCLTTAVLVALSIFVIPEFRAIFDDFDLELPGLTVGLLSMASWLSRWGGLVIATLVVALVLLVLSANRWLPASTWLGDRFRPPLSRRTAVARFARFTADLLESGVNLPDALRIAGFTVGRSRLQRAAWNLANDLESTRESSWRAYQGPLSTTIVHGLTSEMSSAARVRLLREISMCHAERVRIGLSWTSGIIEPIAILLVGTAVGWVVLALFLPLVKLVEGLSG